MTASGDDQPTRKRWRLVPIPVVTGVLAVIAAVMLAVFPSGCRGLNPTYRVTAAVPVGHGPRTVAVDPGTRTVYVTNNPGNFTAGTVSVIEHR